MSRTRRIARPHGRAPRTAEDHDRRIDWTATWAGGSGRTCPGRSRTPSWATRTRCGLLAVALLADGHALLEDVPGVGKTLLARAFSRALGLQFSRVQGTPDLLPGDVTGSSIYEGGSFRFIPGPIFTNVLLVDEINRATPRTQAALLEAMQERQVSADGESRPLPEPFLVLATENPVELEGTFALPEAELDRFLVRITLGYPVARVRAADRAALPLRRRAARRRSGRDRCGADRAPARQSSAS